MKKSTTLPESVTDATVAKWYHKTGDGVQRDSNLLDLETDKVMLEVPAPKSGVLQEVLVKEGDVVTAGQVLGILQEGEVPVAKAESAPTADAQPAAAPAAAAMKGDAVAGPSARRVAGEHGVDVNEVPGTGRGGLTKTDVSAFAGGGGSRTENVCPCQDYALNCRTFS